jgi:putative lipoprotein
MKMVRIILGLVFSLVLLSVPGMVSAQSTAAVSGTLTYRERIALPANAIVTVQIAELRAGAMPLVIAEQRFTTNGAQPPFRYTIAYDPTRINSSAQYTIQSNISVDGQVRFSTNQVYRVITGGAPVSDVNIMLVASGTGPNLPPTSGGALPLTLAGLALVAAAMLFIVRRRFLIRS